MTPELSREAAARLLNAERELIKYDPNEPRDWHGRWTAGEGAPAPMVSPTSDDASNRGSESADTRVSNPERASGEPNLSLIPAAFTAPDNEVNGVASQGPGSFEQEFEQKYDDLGPVDFAKRVIEFGDWLARQGQNLSPAEWKKGIKGQGDKWQDYVGEQNPDLIELPPNSKTFDHFNAKTGEAISEKTMNTLSVGYIKNPQRIFNRLRNYVDDAVDYEPRTDSDLDPANIQSKTIHLAIPEYTSPTQWRYINRAIIYAKENGVTIVITRIKE